MTDDQGAWVHRAFIWRPALGPVEAWADTLRDDGWEPEVEAGTPHYDEDGRALIVPARRWFADPWHIPPR